MIFSKPMKQFLHKSWQWLKKVQLFYFARVRLTNKDYRSALSDMRHTNVKSPETIKREMTLVRDYWRCQPLHYVRYRLFEKQLTDDQLLGYVPPFFFYTRYMPKLLRCSTADQYKYNSKIYQIHELQKRQIPIPVAVASIENGVCHDLQGNEMESDVLLSEFGHDEKIFCKPDDGQGGYGIVVFQRRDNGLYNRTSQQFVSSLSEGLERHITYVVQKQIFQTDYLDKIFPGAVNTLRVVTKAFKGKLTMACCILRMGRGHNDVDNSAQGGMSVNINLQTGKFDDRAITEHTNESFDRHPDTGFVFQGNGIPDWQNVKTQILDMAAKFVELPLVGWDFALTPKGVIVVEMNIGAGLDHMQLSAGPMADVLEISPKRLKQ